MSGLRDRTPLQFTPYKSTQSDCLLVSVSVGVGTAAALATTAIHAVQRHTTQATGTGDTPTAQILLPTRTATQTSAASAAQIAPAPADTVSALPLLSKRLSKSASRSIADQSAFETALAFGWQAALKGQNPQDTSRYWGEAALLWQQAIYFLEQVSQSDPDYSAAQEKRAVYALNLRQIMSRQIAALSAEANTEPLTTTIAQATQANAPQPDASSSIPAAVEKDWIETAKQQGWQAALAGQNAPHPTEKWAEVSRLWQAALQTLENIDPQSPQYAEAEAIKARYQANLAAIRKRYQVEQTTDQMLRSLQATLIEINRSNPVATDKKRSQLIAILERLRTIPLGTMAYAKAQALIETTTAELSNLPAEPSPRIAVFNEAETQ